MLVYSQLKVASLENLSADPVLLPLGRVFFDTVLDRPKIKISSGVKQLVYTDDPVIIGTNGTAATNVKLHRAGTGIAQAILGSDATAEGSQATTLAQFGFRNQNFTDAGKPAAGQAGRIIWLTDVLKLQYDTGSVWTDVGSLANPMTTGGDLIYGGSGGTAVRLPNGSAGQYLASQGGTSAPVWTSFANTAYSAKSANYTATLADEVIVVNATSGAITITLPLASGNTGKKYTIKKSDGTVNKVIISRSGSDYVETGSSFALYNLNDRVEFICSGTGWEIVNLSITKESVVCSTGTTGYTQTANTFITAPLSITSDPTRYPITSNSITIRKTAKYRIICRNSFISTNGELGYVTYSVNGANESSNFINGYLMDANAAGSTSQITESRELVFNEGDVLRLRTQMATNTRSGNNGRLELMEI